MKKIEIYGTGCTKCNKLEEISRKAALELGLQCEIIKVKDIKKIIDLGVMTVPALVVDGQVKVSGKLPSLEEVKDLIK